MNIESYRPKKWLLLFSLIFSGVLFAIGIYFSVLGFEIAKTDCPIDEIILAGEISIAFLLLGFITAISIKKFIFYSYIFQGKTLSARGCFNSIKVEKCDLVDTRIGPDSCWFKTSCGKRFYIGREYRNFKAFKARFKRFSS